jgi:hypothetical protein
VGQWSDLNSRCGLMEGMHDKNHDGDLFVAMLL